MNFALDSHHASTHNMVMPHQSLLVTSPTRQHHIGRIVAIKGSMFSGKSSELIHSANIFMRCKVPVHIVAPGISRRKETERERIESHDGVVALCETIYLECDALKQHCEQIIADFTRKLASRRQSLILSSASFSTGSNSPDETPSPALPCPSAAARPLTRPFTGTRSMSASFCESDSDSDPQPCSASEKRAEQQQFEDGKACDSTKPLVAPVLCIDEAQFFGDLIESCCALRRAGITVVVAGLALTYQRQPFGEMHRLLDYADETVEKKAVCAVCDSWNATLTHRTSSDEGVVLVGGKNLYKPVCQLCFENLHHAQGKK